MKSIRIAIAGLGNCASALLQGIAYYRGRRAEDAIGLMHWEIGGYQPGDIDIVAAFDVDARKVGRPVGEALFAAPNCARVFCRDVSAYGLTVRMGRVLDGVGDHMREYEDDRTFRVSEADQPDKAEVVRVLRETRAEALLNYLPVGSEAASRFYAECALEAGVGFINNIPVFIASDPDWGRRFEEAGVPCIGDDIKSQLGATIVHRVLANLFAKRGVALDSTYQLNFGGNTDFLNMLDRKRLQSKKVSKTEAVQCQNDHPLPADRIHIGPSDYVPAQKDNKVAYIRMEGRLFGDLPMNLELRLSVEDSPNSAGVVIDAVRCLKLARERGIGGPLFSPSSYFMKHPPRQVPDETAYLHTEEFISGRRER
ncbi:MAG: inositol-3-phosphate synthase [Thermodesulfobacteriota bacterium]